MPAISRSQMSNSRATEPDISVPGPNRRASDTFDVRQSPQPRRNRSVSAPALQIPAPGRQHAEVVADPRPGAADLVATRELLQDFKDSVKAAAVSGQVRHFDAKVRQFHALQQTYADVQKDFSPLRLDAFRAAIAECVRDPHGFNVPNAAGLVAEANKLEQALKIPVSDYRPALRQIYESAANFLASRDDEVGKTTRALWQSKARALRAEAPIA